MVDEQDGLACLFHHDFFDLALALIRFHDAFVHIDALAADEGVVDEVVVQRLIGRGTCQGTGTLAHLAARADHLEAVVHEIVHEADGVGDDGDVALPFELLQQGLAGRARIHHDGVAVMDELDGLVGDAQLALAVDGAAARVGEVFAGTFRKDGAAVAASQEILVFEFLEVTPDGFLRDVKEFGEFRDIDLAFAPQELHDFLSAFQTEHDASVRENLWLAV